MVNRKEYYEMKVSISAALVFAVFAATTTAQAAANGTKTRSTSVVIDSPADLPELAQRRSEAMYLHNTGSGQAFLYLEQDQGRTLAILDVTDPASIREVGGASLGAESSYDFVQALDNSAVLIRFRDRSGFAIVNFRKYKQPVLITTAGLLNPASIQPFGQHTLLLTSANGAVTPAQDSQYQFVDVWNPSKPTSLVILQGVRQRLDRPDTGTLFLLSNEGLTVIRHPSMEEEYQLEMNQTN
jgi:hypothetical protein